jgi:hypothetical protein
MRYDIVPSEVPLGIIDETGMPDEFYEVFDPRLFRLKQSHYNVFHAAGLRYQRAVGRQLFWGSSYFFVWREGAELKFPMQLDVPKRFMSKYDWTCALVSLPKKNNAAIARWLESSTESTVGSRKAHVSVLMPTMNRVVDSSEVEVSLNERVLIAVTRTSIDPLGDDFRIESAGGERTFHLSGDERALIQLRRGSAKDEYLFMRYGVEPGILLHFTEATRLSRSRRATIQARTSNGRLVRAPFYSIEARALLRGVRKRDFHEATLLLESPISGTVMARGVDAQSWSRQKVGDENAAGNPGALHAFDLTRLVRRVDTEIIIDLAGFGSQYLPSLGRHQASQPLEPGTRERLLWILSEQSARTGNSGTASNYTESQSDESLISEFRAMQGARELLCHARVVSTELSALRGNRDSG